MRNGEQYELEITNNCGSIKYVNKSTGSILADGSITTDEGNGKTIVVNTDNCQVTIGTTSTHTVSQCDCGQGSSGISELKNIFVTFSTDENDPLSGNNPTIWKQVDLWWNMASDPALDYFITMTQNGQNLGRVQYSKVGSTFKNTANREGINGNVLILNDNPEFGQPTFDKSDKFTYEIAVVENSETPYEEALYKYSQESGKFSPYGRFGGSFAIKKDDYCEPLPIDFNIEAEAYSEVVGEIKYNIFDNDWETAAYIAPCVLSGVIMINGSGPLESVCYYNASVSYELFDRIEFELD